MEQIHRSSLALCPAKLTRRKLTFVLVADGLRFLKVTEPFGNTDVLRNNGVTRPLGVARRGAEVSDKVCRGVMDWDAVSGRFVRLPVPVKKLYACV